MTATRPDWGHSYERTHRTTAATLERLRREGASFHRFGDSGRTCNPSRMSDRKIDDAARLHAERVVNRAIIEHNEQVVRGARRRAA